MFGKGNSNGLVHGNRGAGKSRGSLAGSEAGGTNQQQFRNTAASGAKSILTISLVPTTASNAHHIHEHEGNSTMSEKHKCHECNHEFPSQMLLQVHRYCPAESKDPWLCRACGTRFAEVNLLDLHFENYQGCCHVSNVCCEHSYSRTPTVQGTATDQDQNRKMFTCCRCGVRFDNFNSLQIHGPTHAIALFQDRNGVSYQCGSCTTNFKGPSDMRKHMEIHPVYMCRQGYAVQLNKEPFACFICGSKFTHMGKCTKHIRRTHKKSRKVSKQYVVVNPDILDPNETEIATDASEKQVLKSSQTDAVKTRKEGNKETENLARKRTKSCLDPPAGISNALQNNTGRENPDDSPNSLLEICNSSHASTESGSWYQNPTIVESQYSQRRAVKRVLEVDKKLDDHNLQHDRVPSWPKQLEQLRQNRISNQITAPHPNVAEIVPNVCRNEESEIFHNTGNILSSRLQSATVETVTSSYKCFMCGSVFNDEDRLVRHIKESYETLSRLGAGKIFSRVFKLPTKLVKEKAATSTSAQESQSRSHTGERPFDGEPCDERLVWWRASNLSIDSNTGKRTYRCPKIKCSKAFNNQKHFYEHLNYFKGFFCQECHKNNLCAWELQKHKKRHGNVRKFLCPTCGRLLNNLSELKYHFCNTSEPSSATSFVCTICAKQYVLHKRLVRHMDQVLGESVAVAQQQLGVAGDARKNKETRTEAVTSAAEAQTKTVEETSEPDKSADETYKDDGISSISHIENARRDTCGRSQIISTSISPDEVPGFGKNCSSASRTELIAVETSKIPEYHIAASGSEGHQNISEAGAASIIEEEQFRWLVSLPKEWYEKTRNEPQ